MTMKILAITAVFAGLISFVAPAGAQGPKNLAERLGYAADAKLLIVHADDIGLSRSVNIAAGNAFENGAITSGSVIVPSPWFPDFAAYYREHQPVDVGIHIPLTLRYPASWMTTGISIPPWRRWRSMPCRTRRRERFGLRSNARLRSGSGRPTSIRTWDP